MNHRIPHRLARALLLFLIFLAVRFDLSASPPETASDHDHRLAPNDDLQGVFSTDWSESKLPRSSGSIAAADFGNNASSAQQQQGALSGKIVFMNSGHGWTFDPTYWRLQRGVGNTMNEDYGNLDQLNFFAAYCFNAGATVVSMRPLGHQTNEVILDNDDAAVTFSGTWSTSSSTLFWGNSGDVPYRYASFAATETATVTYTPSIPVAGYYPVYCWTRHGSDRGDQLYRIRHTGGESQIRIPHHMVGNGWIYLGEYYFNAGSSAAVGSVVISNLRGTATGSVVIADAIRFGNGMGTVNFGTGVSGYPREDENMRYWIQANLAQGQSTSLYNSSGDDESDSWSAPPKMSAEMNRQEAGDIYDRVHISFHSNAGVGTSRGTVALITGDPTPRQAELANLAGGEVNDDLVALGTPPLETNWFNRSTHTYTGGYSEIDGSLFGYEMAATIIEVAYHDNVPDALLMRDPKARSAIGKASMHAVVKYMNQYDTNGAPPLAFLPEAPTNPRAVAVNTNGHITLSWTAPVILGGSQNPTNYVIYRSTNGYGFGNAVSVGNVTNYTVTNLAANLDYYFRLTAVNAGGESMPSEVVGCRASSTNGAPRVLVINAFDRFERTTNLRQDVSQQNWDRPGNSGAIERVFSRWNNSFDYVVQHGKSIASSGRAFDSCQNETVANGQIVLSNYAAVVWTSGNESTTGETFSSAEQTKISSYVAGGGNLFASGSEIAWDLDRTTGPTAADRTFFHNSLHASFVADTSGSYTVTSVVSSIFNGIANATFDDGSRGIYWVGAPDVLGAFGSGASAALNYSGGTGGAAAVQYDGSAGGGKVVSFGFPFETMTNATLRNQYMSAILNFFVSGAPTISAQPASLSVNQGSNATFTVTAVGTAPLNYQWYFGAGTISGATASSYTRTNVQPSHVGNYFVVVTNGFGSITSATATLSLNVAPSISAQPQNQTGSEGGSANFSVTATGTAPLSYQWRKGAVNLSNGANVSGATSSSLFLSSLVLSDATNYSVVITNVAGSVTSSNATLTVNSNSSARTLNLPPRAANAPNGTEFINLISSLSLTDRENVIFAQIAQGNVPNFMRTLVAVTTNAVISGTNHTVTYHVTPDYLAVGTDADYFLEPMTPILGQRISDLLNCSMPTRKMVDNIWTAATVKLAPSTIPPSAEMTTVPVFADHNTTVRGQRNANGTPLGALVGGDKKDVIISTTIYGNPSPLRVVIYGWHQLNGSAIQPRYNGHEDTYADYSHGIRLVDNSIVVDGAANTIAQILADASLNALLSDEGVITVPRYPLTASAPIILTQPYSQTVNAGSNVVFSATVFGDATLLYTWKLNGNSISGATSSALILTNVQSANAGSYTVAVTNGVGSATSIPAVLKVQTNSNQILFSDNFNSDSATNWNLYQGSGNATPDFTTNWAFNYGFIQYTFNGTDYLIPPAPNSTDGSSKGIKLTVNDNDATASISGVNIYPKNQSFSNNFVLKCDMWLNYPGNAGGAGGSGTTEHAIFGINHLGTQPNWVATSASSTDGIWFGADGEGDDARDYRAYVGNLSGVQTELIGATASGLSASNNTAAIYTSLFPTTRFETVGSPGKNWVAVEVIQTNNNLIWKLDGTLVAQRTNTSTFTNGNIMLGLMDVFSSIASPAADSFVIFDNVRVERLSDSSSQSPTIVSQPQDQPVFQGSNANFSVTASGTPTLGYQWKFDGTDISGATASTYTRSNAQPSHVGNYSVVVSNGFGSVTSSDAALTIIVPPTISVQPTDQSANFGSTVTFSATAVGAALTYQWKRGGTDLVNGGNVSGATTATLTLNSITQNDATNYSLLVSNTMGTAVSSNATLIVIDPVILVQPVGSTNNPGAIVTLSVSAIGTAPLNFQWTKNGDNLSDGGNVSGATAATLTLNSFSENDSGTYAVSVANSESSVISSDATLAVRTFYPPTWTQFPGWPTNNTTRNDDIFFADPTNGWSARGTDGIYRTMDGGQTWGKVYTNVPAKTAHFRSIGFASATRGWAGNLGPGSYDGAVNDTNLLYETFDGGANWSVTPGINGTGMQGFCAMHIFDSQHIYGVGRVRGPAYFAKTEDGGSSWSVNNVTNSAGDIVMGGLMDVYFKDTTNGFAVGMGTNLFTSTNYHGRIAKTTDGGLTWTPVVTMTIVSNYFWKMSWPSASVGYASLQQNAAHSSVIFYKTTDGGATWVSNGIPFSAIGVSATSFGLQGIGFVSETEGWMGGSSSLNSPTNFIHTTDGGLTWTKEGYSNTKSINRIRFVGPTLGYMSGQALHIYRSPLAITTPPQNQIATTGSTANFSVVATGNSPLSYQWRKGGINLSNGGNISGATTATLTLANVSQSEAGSYSVVITNLTGTLTSTSATLTVVDPPVISLHPSDQNANFGDPVTFSVTANGTDPLTYQWQKDGMDLSDGENVLGANSPSLMLQSVTQNETGSYRVFVGNAVNLVVSSNAVLTVIDPVITSQPINRTNTPGSTATFSVVVIGTDPLSYQWKKGAVDLSNGGNVLGATSATLTLASVSSGDAGNYSVVVSNVIGSVASDAASLTLSGITDFVLPVVSIISPANNAHVVSGGVTVSGTAKDTAPGVIAGVKYRLWPETNWSSATIVGGGTVTNWSASNVSLEPGTNMVHAYSYDGGGNPSPLKTNTFYYDLSSPLTVKIVGNGQVKSATLANIVNNQQISLLVGRPSSLTAFIASGVNYVFTNWTGGSNVNSLTNITTNLVYSFQMQTDLILQANFITNPFTPVAGSYAGLFSDTNNGVSHASAGFFTVKVTEKAAYSATFYFDGDKITASGKFDLSGQAGKSVSRATKGKGNVELFLALDWAGKMGGTLGNSNWTATLEGDRATFSLSNPATNHVGAFTFLVPRTNYPVQMPGGMGYAAGTNSLLGVVKISGGGLGDGAKLSQKVSLSSDGQWPFYAPLYKTTNTVTNPVSQAVIVNKSDYRGSVMGWVTFSNREPVGTLHWIKTSGASNYLYPSGFTSAVPLLGSLYTPPSNGVRALTITNGTATYYDGNLAGPIAWSVNWSSNNAITVSAGVIKPTFTLTPKTGLLKGTFPHPQLGNAPVNFFGAVLQNQNHAAGYFIGTNHSGMMKLE